MRSGACSEDTDQVRPYSRSVWDRAARSTARLVDVLIPPACIGCKRPSGSHDALCGACWSRINFIRAPLCDRLGIPLPFDTGSLTVSAGALADPPAYDRARAVARFDGGMRDLVHAFKYSDRHDARRLFGRWLLSAGTELLSDADVIVPVPLHRWRLLRRRFNQAAMLAREVGRLSGVRWDPGALVRSRATATQVGRTRDDRRRNIAGAFAVPSNKRIGLEGRGVVLIDDVITTGATVEAAARSLRRAGAIRVDVLALALVTDDSLLNF